MTSKEITISNGLLPAPQEFSMFQTIAKNAQMSGLYCGIGGESQIFMILLAARELGIPPMLALNGGIWNIKGKIEISSRLMNNMIRRAGHKLTIKSTDKECTIIGKRCDTDEEHSETFTWAMAEKAGLVRKNKDGSDGIWLKYPEDMLYNRCMSRLARRLFPDVIGNAYVEGEISGEKDPAKLPETQCEDITPQVINDAIKVEDTGLQKISEEQLSELMELEKLADKTWKDNMKIYLKEKCGSEEYKDMPESLFNKCMKSLRTNVENTQVAA